VVPVQVLGKGKGQAILLAVGGAQESLLAKPGTMDLVSDINNARAAAASLADQVMTDHDWLR